MVSVLPTTVPVHKQWIFTPDKLLKTASAEDGISLVDELEGRKLACATAARICMSLSNSRSIQAYHFVTATAACFLHRFYMRRSLRDYPPKEMAAVALFIAYKDCERPERLKTVACMAVSKKQKDDLRKQGRDSGRDPAVRPDDPIVVALLPQMLSQEEVLASTLCFEFIPALPYQPYSLGIRRLFSADDSFRPEDWTTWRTVGWGFINDSLLTPLCVLQPPGIIASAAYILATIALVEGTKLEDLLDSFHDWKGHFGLEPDSVSDRDDVEEAILWTLRNQHRAIPQKVAQETLQALQHREPKPLPPPSFTASMRAALPSPFHQSDYTPLASPLPPSQSPRHPSSQPPPPPSTAGINPYGPQPETGDIEMDMDMESSPALGPGR